MRRFVLAGNVAYTTATDYNTIAAGALGVYYPKDDGTIAVTATGTEIKNVANIVVGRKPEDGGAIIIPIYKNNFSFVKSVYSNAIQFSATVTCPAANILGDYTIIVCKKGVKFNERNKWTATVHATKTMTAEALATALEKLLKNNADNAGVVISRSAAAITIKGAVKGEDFKVITADNLSDVVPTAVTQGFRAMNDANMIKDLANKAAADAGFEYTYDDGVSELYPAYPFNPLEQPDAADGGFVVYTIKFSEPRLDKTTDEAIKQIVQVAFPSAANTTNTSTFEKVLNAMVG